MELLGKYASNYTSNIGIIPSASKYFSSVLQKYLQIITNNDGFD